MADRHDPGACEQDPRPRRRPQLLVGGVAVLILVAGGVAGGVAFTRDDRPRTSATADPPSTATDRGGEEKIVPLDGPYVLVEPHGFAIVGQEHQVPDDEFDVPGPRSTIELRTDGGAEMAISLIREFRRGALVDAAKQLPDSRVTEIAAYAADGHLAAQEAVLIRAGVHDERAHLIWQGVEHRGFDASFDDHVSRRERQRVIEAIRWSPAQPVGVRIAAPLPVGGRRFPHRSTSTSASTSGRRLPRPRRPRSRSLPSRLASATCRSRRSTALDPMMRSCRSSTHEGPAIPGRARR